MEKITNPYRHLVGKEIEHLPERAVRAFDVFTSYEGPDTNWGMKIGVPPWVQEVHNTKTGRCFLFGTGPSLVKELDLLPQMNDEYTFTCNRMRNWKELSFIPWLHCITEPGPTIYWGKIVAETYDYPNAVNKVACTWWPTIAPGWMWLPKAPDDIQVRWEGFFGFGDRLPPIPTAWASPLTIAQLACWMGFTEFYFLGCDTTQGGQAWDVEHGRTKFPRSIQSIYECFDRARMDIEKAGRKVYDCSDGGMLSKVGVLEYVPLREVLHGSDDAGTKG